MKFNKAYVMKIALNPKERRALTIAVVLSVVFGAYFLRHYFSIIAIAAIVAYIFYPLRNRLVKKTGRVWLSTALTILAAFLMLIIPLVIVIILTVFQIESLLRSVPDFNINNLGALGDTFNNYLNQFLSKFPGAKSVNLAEIASSLQGVAKSTAQALLNFILASVGGLPRMFTNAILFIFVLSSFLASGEKIVEMIRKLNPLGPKITNLYLQKMGDMTKAVVKGQFVIAFCQGLIGAISLYIVGWHDLFFFILLILTMLSVIPLGSGILTIPIGLVMILFGDYWQGIFIILVHVIIITNIDNFLRARLVPKSAHINSALMMLAVFSGIAMFGFLGIVLGPVIIILLLSTIQVYMSVAENKATELTDTAS
jgi:predicted PurR-regulated permease PerM